MLAMYLFFWSGWLPPPPSGTISLASRYRRGYRMNWVSAMIGFITWLTTLR